MPFQTEPKARLSELPVTLVLLQSCQSVGIRSTQQLGHLQLAPGIWSAITVAAAASLLLHPSVADLELAQAAGRGGTEWTAPVSKYAISTHGRTAGCGCLVSRVLEGLALHQLGDILVIVILLLNAGQTASTRCTHAASSLLHELRGTLGAQLLHDARHHLRDVLGLRRPADHVGVGCDGCLHLGVGEVDDFLVHEDVDLLNAGDSVDAQPLQSVLQPLVVCAGGLVHRLLLSPD
mmetsp:Transcript_12703/g.38305  ORF Transcript_12703/g.38305 Transcript_12703/m.38305 type:complete len:235 (+) Transcript_12703:132-836(+)